MCTTRSMNGVGSNLCERTVRLVQVFSGGPREFFVVVGNLQAGRLRVSVMSERLVLLLWMKFTATLNFARSTEESTPLVRQLKTEPGLNPKTGTRTGTGLSS